MTGKTHAVAGMAAAVLLIRPDGIGELLMCLSASYVGAVISDIDVKSSGSHKTMFKIITGILLSFFIVFLLDYKFQYGIGTEIQKGILAHSGLWRPLSGGIVFLMICLFGSRKPHRSFMHSILAGILLGICVYLILPRLLPGFLVGMGSHLFLDCWNYKKVQLFYPAGKGVSFEVFQSGGLFDSVLFGSAVLLLGVQIFYCVKGSYF